MKKFDKYFELTIMELVNFTSQDTLMCILKSKTPDNWLLVLCPTPKTVYSVIEFTIYKISAIKPDKYVTSNVAYRFGSFAGDYFGVPSVNGLAIDDEKLQPIPICNFMLADRFQQIFYTED